MEENKSIMKTEIVIAECCASCFHSISNIENQWELWCIPNSINIYVFNKCIKYKLNENRVDTFNGKN